MWIPRRLGLPIAPGAMLSSCVTEWRAVGHNSGQVYLATFFCSVNFLFVLLEGIDYG
jgi:hypothetical protein